MSIPLCDTAHLFVFHVLLLANEVTLFALDAKFMLLRCLVKVFEISQLRGHVHVAYQYVQ